VLFEAHFTKFADGQFLTALALGIAALQDTDDPRARAKEQGSSPRPTQDETWPLSASLWSALLSCYQLLIGIFKFPS
jgi:hypothetical protein